MPISDNANYPEKHFNRVYEHLIIPACENAGFIPVRADDVIKTNYIALDVIKKIIESDMVLCDLSSQNPNVLYELGIRQAFNKPVTLIKDRSTKRIFDIQGFRDFEYDETLRVDNVQNDIEKLSQIIVSTYDEDVENVNSLVSLLSLNPAKIENKTEMSGETKLILNSLSNIEKRLNSIESNYEQEDTVKPFKFYGGDQAFLFEDDEIPDNVGDFLSRKEIESLKKGDSVYHRRFGFGKVLNTEKTGTTNLRIKGHIQFEEYGVKWLLLDFARLRKVI